MRRERCQYPPKKGAEECNECTYAWDAESLCALSRVLEISTLPVFEIYEYVLRA